MEQPKGFASGNQVNRLHKSIYGLKQAPYVWNKLLDQELVAIGFRKNEIDPAIYSRITEKGGKFYIAVHVDDMLLVSHSKGEIQQVKQNLSKKFPIQDLGNIRQYLGMEIVRRRKNRTILLRVRQHINTAIVKAGMKDCRPAFTPQEQTGSQPAAATDSNPSITLYSTIVGSLIYIASTARPDIANAVHQVCKHMHNPTEESWIILKRVIRYLQGTKDLWLELGGDQDNEIQLCGFCDADWGGDADNRRSTTGYCFTAGQGMISWGAKQQKTVALSSAEAEYMAISEAAKEALWLRNLYNTLHYT